jgi:hypothetical protein
MDDKVKQPRKVSCCVFVNPLVPQNQQGDVVIDRKPSGEQFKDTAASKEQESTMKHCCSASLSLPDAMQ